MSNRSFTYNVNRPPPFSDPAFQASNYNYRFFLIRTPITDSVLLAYWIPPNGPEVNLLPSIGDFIKVQGDPKTYKIEFSQVGTDSGAAALDYYVEEVRWGQPESDPAYTIEYDSIVMNKIF